MKLEVYTFWGLMNSATKSLTGLKRILFTSIFQKLQKPHLETRQEALSGYFSCDHLCRTAVCFEKFGGLGFRV